MLSSLAEDMRAFRQPWLWGARCGACPSSTASCLAAGKRRIRTISLRKMVSPHVDQCRRVNGNSYLLLHCPKMKPKGLGCVRVLCLYKGRPVAPQNCKPVDFVWFCISFILSGVAKRSPCVCPANRQETKGVWRPVDPHRLSHQLGCPTIKVGFPDFYL